MKDFLDKFQEAWQSQRTKPHDVDPGQLLKTARLERRIYFWADLSVILILMGVGAWMLWFAFLDIRKQWPWLIYSASDAWVVAYMLFNRWRRRAHSARYDEPLLAHVEWSIKDIEHRRGQDRHTFWWYTLPIALGCMIPPAISFLLDYTRKPEWGPVSALLVTEGMLAAVFYFVHWTIKRAMRIGRAARRQELEALRALRETL